MGMSKETARIRAEELADGLHSAAIHLLRRVRKQDTKTGEGPARLSALSVLVFGGPMTLGQLAAAEQVRPPTMTRIVTGLERVGLVKRVPDKEDGRRVKIQPTVEGAHLLKRGRKLRVAYLARQLEQLSGEDRANLEQGLRVIRKVLEDWGKE
jgi:DNA-binding MarR family transcriptional regulator